MSVTACEAIQVMSDHLDGLHAALDGLDDTDLQQTLRSMETVSRKTQSVLLAVVAETETRGMAARQGFGTTQRMLSAVLRLSGSEARSRVDQAALVGARRGLTGESLPPRLPATAAALAAGQLGAGQLRVITETMAAVPDSVSEPQRERAEADLVKYARDFDPRRLRIVAARLLAALDPDGPRPADADQLAATRGELWLRDRRDGRLGLEGWLDAESGAMVRALIEQLAAPRPAAEGIPDQRSRPQRQAEALIEICERARAADGFPTSAGEPPHVTVTMHLEALRAELDAAVLDYGKRLSASDARRLACDCKVIPVVLGGDSEPLDVGRAMRTVPLGIRRALVARDGGCCFPGCDRPPGLCVVHHARHWIDHGGTCVANCCMLCPAHHHQVHLQGWEVVIHGGRVDFIPPAIIDPDRRPLHNPLRC